MYTVAPRRWVKMECIMPLTSDKSKDLHDSETRMFHLDTGFLTKSTTSSPLYAYEPSPIPFGGANQFAIPRVAICLLSKVLMY